MHGTDADGVRGARHRPDSTASPGKRETLVYAMDLEELRAFLAIVRTGSFLAASSELGVSRGMLRCRVDALEARVGARLVERTPKGVMTPHMLVLGFAPLRDALPRVAQGFVGRM